MNDRYLYRAKHSLKSKKWHIGNLVEEPDGLYLRDNKNNIMVYIQDPSTICQCTGLKDKNGKLILENDIMVAHLDDSFPEDTTYARVVWNNNGFCTKEQGSEDISPLDKFDQEYFEVCGNLFDNPELLEVGESGIF